jgi:hypothetical protein
VFNDAGTGDFEVVLVQGDALAGPSLFKTFHAHAAADFHEVTIRIDKHIVMLGLKGF